MCRTWTWIRRGENPSAYTADTGMGFGGVLAVLSCMDQGMCDARRTDIAKGIQITSTSIHALMPLNIASPDGPWTKDHAGRPVGQSCPCTRMRAHTHTANHKQSSKSSETRHLLSSRRAAQDSWGRCDGVRTGPTVIQFNCSALCCALPRDPFLTIGVCVYANLCWVQPPNGTHTHTHTHTHTPVGHDKQAQRRR